ncbi:MAG: Eco57I restriction-modification methylase domain-containing protein [Steroidobacterales bacterium]
MTLKPPLAQIERRRLAWQQARDAARSPQQRNRLGQFATPGALARQMLHHAHRLVGASPVRFLDPAIGTGSFYAALLREWPLAAIQAAVGFEIDAHYAQPCRTLWRGTPLQLRLEDFTAAAAPAPEPGRFNLLICNPPYVRHHHLQRSAKLRLHQRSMTAAGVRLSGLAGLYAHFIALAHPWMSEGAIAGWLIPSEFMDVNYGRELKRYLLHAVTLLRIHRFDPTEVQFNDALVSSAIVWLRNRKPERDHQIEFTFGGSLERPRTRGLAGASGLERAAKWTGFPAVLGQARAPAAVTLGETFHVKRGIATGANAFFIMTREQAGERGIPRQCLRPILPGPRQLEADEVLADEHGEPQLARSLWLLDCRLSEQQVREEYPRFWRYLEAGRAEFSQGYLCSRRAPWYAQEAREPTWFLCTYMARNCGGAHRFIFNRSMAIGANTYLMLYPRAALARLIDGDPVRARQAWQALQGIATEVMIAAGRVYGGGLHKLEPKELAAIPAAGIAALLRA